MPSKRKQPTRMRSRVPTPNRQADFLLFFEQARATREQAGLPPDPTCEALLELWRAREAYARAPLEPDVLQNADNILADLQLKLLATGIGQDWETPTL